MDYFPCLLQFNLLPGTDVIFSDNEAETVGGAILVNNPSIAQDFDPVYNTDCFFQSDRDKALTPDSWVCCIVSWQLLFVLHLKPSQPNPEWSVSYM